MATLVESMPARDSGLSWSGIFSGTFVFLAIEATFGVLGAAIFATATNPNSNNPVGPGVSAGFGIWMVILSIIAMYFGAKTAGRLSSATRGSGTYIGLVTFGMCIFASILIVVMSLSSTAAGVAVQANATARNVVSIVTTGGYWLFVTLLLAMIAAAIGGAHGVHRLPAIGADRNVPPTDVRKVA